MRPCSGSEKRPRSERYTVRFTTLEAALLRTHADQAGLSVASFLRVAALNMPAPQQGRRPPIDREMTAHLIGAMGEAASAFRDAASLADRAMLEASFHEFSEFRLIVLESMGRTP